MQKSTAVATDGPQPQMSERAVRLRLAILGGGRAAWAYGSAWRRVGAPISGIWLRNSSRSRLPELLGAPRQPIERLARESDLLLIAVSDSAIAETAAMIPQSAAVVFHASGALPSARGGFSLHPLRVLPPVGEPSDLQDALLVFEGGHREIAVEIAAAVGARFAEVTAAMKPLYHAAAVFGANYVAAILEIAEELMTRAGIADSRSDIAGLAESAVENWRSHDDSRRFTGPAARGDLETIERHLGALENDPQVSQIYGVLADRIARAILARSE
jgi:predicted short-subunit dehydrogenase-like oxidoreductase (DUF2520 family)